MNRWMSAILFLIGAVVLGLGISAANSVGSETVQAVSGMPTDKALWFMLGGGAMALIGLVGMFKKPTSLPHA
jgi:hypothetical protein